MGWGVSQDYNYCHINEDLLTFQSMQRIYCILLRTDTNICSEMTKNLHSHSVRKKFNLTSGAHRMFLWEGLLPKGDIIYKNVFHAKVNIIFITNSFAKGAWHLLDH